MESVLAAAERRADSALELLRAWVQQSSFSGDVGGVNAMGELLKHAFGGFSELTLQVRRGNGVGDHLFWRTPAWGTAADRHVLLVGHHDTVFPPGTFEGWKRTGDRIQGPGVLDMKGGIAVVHTAVAALHDTGRLANLPIGFISVGDEEIGSEDSRSFADEHATASSCALVFEAGRAQDAIITRRKGTGALTVKATGRAAHAGNCHADGINAILALSRFIVEAQKLTDYDRGLTVNVGTISGGSSRNTVPAYAECALDFRSECAADGHALVSRLHQLSNDVATEATFELIGGVKRPPLERTQASAALYERYATAARASGLGDGEAALLGGGSDANNIAALGIPCLDGLGPRGAGFHTHDEYIEASSLPLRTAALIRFLLS